MSGTRSIKGSRSHARPGLLSRFRDLFRGHPDLPQMHGAPVMDLQHEDGLDVADAIRQAPEPDWDSAAVHHEAAPYRGETMVDIGRHAPRRFVPEGAVHREPRAAAPRIRPAARTSPPGPAPR